MSAPLRSEQFEALLQKLGPDRDQAGVRYQELRRRLIVVFEHRRCPHPEELADETLDRAARRIHELGNEFDGSDPARFVFGVAWNIAHESFRRHSPVPLPENWERQPKTSPPAQGEPEHACLDHCLEQLTPPERDLLLGYHEGKRGAKIQRRSELAGELGLSPNALRLRIYRLTDQMRGCVAHCMNAGRGAGASASV
jgi:DNA-directed RNA polymerase specialized sigma24 family protein